MIKTNATLRFPAILAAAASLAISPLAAQDPAELIGDEAELIAQEAADDIRSIDPTTGGPSAVIDPSLPAPYGAEILAGEAPEQTIARMPAITGPASAPAPRGPAARSIPARSAPPAAALANNTASLPAAPSMPRPAPGSPAIQQPPQIAPQGAYISDEPVAPVIESDDPFVIKSILPINGSIRYGEWYWDETRAPANGKLIVTVDLDARIISVFRDGHEIGTSVALLGTKKHPTPLGVFPILTKEIDNVSEKYNNAPMPYTLRLTWSGIAIHGSPVLNGYASHGCIGVPDDFAEKLFEIAKRGDKVVITKGNLVNVGHKML